jgi:endoglucanase
VRNLPALILAGLLASVAAPARLLYPGVNLAGAEFNPKRIPGRPGADYLYPAPEDLDYFVSRGLSTIRLPFRWERLQPSLYGPLDRMELARIDAVVAEAAKRHAFIILDPHNYARYGDAVIGSPELPDKAFADFWRRLAAHYANNRTVLFGLMNEPHDMPIAAWFRAAQAAIGAIRATGARNILLVPGASWTGAHSWFSRWDGTTNAEQFEKLSDPANNFVAEIHQYFDGNFSGTGKTCRSADIGVEKIAPVTAWLREHRYRALLGEFGTSNDPLCLQALDRTLAHLAKNDDVWIGWTYWAGGKWMGRYPYTVTPGPQGDTPQMRVLLRYVGRD